jgi:stage V sporulation protein B
MTGYFTAANRIGTLAAVEIAEQLCSMAVTMLFLTLWAGADPGRACMSVIFGSSIGACLTLFCLVCLRIREKSDPGGPIPVRSRLLQTAVPLALADVLKSGISTTENLMVPRRLALYAGTLSPLAAFGTVCGMVFPVLTFPTVFLFGVTELLIPELARCNAVGSTTRIQYLASKSLRVALLYGTVCATVLFLIAKPLCLRLYDSPEAGQYLRLLAPLVVMLYCDNVTDAMIKGLGEQKASVRYNICTNIMDVILLYLLLPRFGITGYFISFTVTHVINFILSLRRLLKITGLSLKMTVPVLTVTAGIVATSLAGFVKNIILCVLAGFLLLSSLFVLFGIIQKEDMLWVRNLLKGKNRPA